MPLNSKIDGSMQFFFPLQIPRSWSRAVPGEKFRACLQLGSGTQQFARIIGRSPFREGSQGGCESQ